MDIDRLREFEVLARTLNFHAAASELFESQSTLSKHLASLETELGVTLFHRQPVVSLTPAGAFFHRSVEPLLSEMEVRLNEIVERTRAVEETSVGLGMPNCVYTIDGYHAAVREMRERFNRKHHPHVLRVDYQKWEPPFPDTFAAALSDGTDCSFFFTPTNAVPDEVVPDLYEGFDPEFRRIGSQEYYLVVEADSRLGRQETIKPADLSGVQLYGDGTHALGRSRMDSFARTFKRDAGVELRGFDVLRTYDKSDTTEGYLAVELGDGAFFLCDAELSTGNFSGQNKLVKRRIDGFPVVLDYWCFWKKDSLSDLQREAIALMGEQGDSASEELAGSLSAEGESAQP